MSGKIPVEPGIIRETIAEWISEGISKENLGYPSEETTQVEFPHAISEIIRGGIPEVNLGRMTKGIPGAFLDGIAEKFSAGIPVGFNKGILDS